MFANDGQYVPGYRLIRTSHDNGNIGSQHIAEASRSHEPFSQAVKALPGLLGSNKRSGIWSALRYSIQGCPETQNPALYNPKP